MKTCQIYPVSAGGGAYQWKWRCVDGKRKSASARGFELFYDCVEDVRNHGGEVDLEHVHRDIANAHAKIKIVPTSHRA